MHNEITYVVGHKKPDSDSIISAIAYAAYLNSRQIPAKPCRLGPLNEETQFLLHRFGFEEPDYLEDARVRLKEIEYIDPVTLSMETTIFEALDTMHTYNTRLLAVVNEDSKVQGIVTRSDLSVLGMGDTALGIDLLKETSVEAMAKTIEGSIVYKAKTTHVNGKVSIIALASTKLDRYEIADRIVIIGNDPQAQIESIQKGAGILIVVWAKGIQKEVLEEAKKRQCSIILSGLGTMNTSRYLYFSIPVSLIMQKKVITFKENEFVEDVMIKMRETTFNTYPILNEANVLIGYVTRYHVMNAQNKRIVLVDHNEFSQSVKGIEKANLVEVIDHHRIHNFSTLQPISFRNEIIGSTTSIVASIYKENNVSISKSLAGLMLGAIISDALNFQSPTTTNKDILIAQELSEISHQNIERLANAMFSITMNLDPNMNLEELRSKIQSDMKAFTIHDHGVLISQVFLLELDTLTYFEEKIRAILSDLEKQCDLCVLAFTSVKEKGSIFYLSGTLKEKVEEQMKEKTFMDKILSRKKQIVPMVTTILDMYG